MKSPTESLRKKCVDIAKKIAKMKVGEVCEHCGRSKKQGWQMHGSHIYPEGVYKSMSADIDNILCLCATCHTGGFWKNASKPSWHEDPIYFGDWFRKKYPERYEELKIRSRKTKLCDLQFWQEKYKILNGIWKQSKQKVIIQNELRQNL